MRFAFLDHTSPEPYVSFKHKHNYEMVESEASPRSWHCIPSCMRGDYIPIVTRPPEFYAENYDMLMLMGQTEWAILTQYALSIKQLNPKIYITGLYKDQLETHAGLCSTREGYAKDFSQFMDTIDEFISPQKELVDYYQLFGKAKTVYLPPPWPISFIEQYLVPWEQRDNTIVIAPYQFKYTGRYMLTNILIGKALIKVFPEYKLRIMQPVDIDDIQPYLNDIGLSEENYELRPDMLWRDFLPELAKSKLVLNMDMLATPGQYSLDCAALEIPCIGGNGAGQGICFADLAFDTVDFEEIVGTAAVMLGNENLAKNKTYTAKQIVRSLDYGMSEERINKLYETWLETNCISSYTHLKGKDEDGT